MKKDTKKGTIKVKVTQLTKQTIAVVESVSLETIGSMVSMPAAPVGAMASKKPICLAINGMETTDRSSRVTLDRKATAPISAEKGAMMTGASEYQAKPDATAAPSFHR